MKKKKGGKRYHNGFQDLTELVYAPLQAVAQSNQRLSAGILDLIGTAGETSPAEQDGTIHLKTVDLAYQQISNDGSSDKVIEEVEIKLPLLSVLPMTGLQVQKTKISFDAEIKRTRGNKKQYMLEGRICSGKRQRRKKDGLPKISFELEVESAPVPEGLARFLDILNANPIPQTLCAKQVDENGLLCVGEEGIYYQKKRSLKAEDGRLADAARKVDALIGRKKLMFDNLLREISPYAGTFDTLFPGTSQEEQILNKFEGEGEDGELRGLYQQILTLTVSLRRLQGRSLEIADELVALEIARVTGEEFHA